MANMMEAGGVPGRVHITQATVDCLDGKYDVEPGHGQTRSQYLRDNNVTTYFIIPPLCRRKVRSALGSAHRRKLSFKNVSNVVMQLLHSIKYSVEVPFSHMAVPPQEKHNSITKKSSILSDKFKRPFKKRHSSLPHTPSNRVNKFLAQAIEARSVAREKSTHVSLVTLCFRDGNREREYHEEVDAGFGNSLLCSLFLLLFLAAVQALVLPWTQLFLLLFLGAFVTISVMLILLLAAKIKATTWDPCRRFILRLVLTILAITVIYSMAQVNIFTCEQPKHPACIFNTTDLSEPVKSSRLGLIRTWCLLPEYIPVSCVMGFISVAVFLRLPFLVKMLLLISMATVYFLHIFITHPPLFQCYNTTVGAVVPTEALGVIYIIVFLLSVLAHGRQVEWTARLDFLWQCQALEEKQEMDALQESNKHILFNLLPSHVATHFLDNQFRSNTDLYHQSYNRVGVMFASIPNFHEFYMEIDLNNQGTECLRLLNEIIVDFDQLLDDDRFNAVDKIKTVGSTYIAAVGLMPDMRIQDTEESAAFYMCMLAELVVAFRGKLDNINENSYNNFTLRVGMNIGPVVAGVIGARKPQYDIWGNTVNVASRMDSTGLPGQIQITEDVYQVLRKYYNFKCRGKVKVKGKGEMTTYFLLDRKPFPVLIRESNASLFQQFTHQHHIQHTYGNMCVETATPLAVIPPQVPSHGRNSSNCSGGSLGQVGMSRMRSQELYEDKHGASLNIHLNSDSVLCKGTGSQGCKTFGECYQCEQVPLLNTSGSSAPLIAHVLPQHNITQIRTNNLKSATPTRASVQQMQPRCKDIPVMFKPFIPSRQKPSRLKEYSFSCKRTNINGIDNRGIQGPFSEGRRPNQNQSHHKEREWYELHNKAIEINKNNLGRGLILPSVPRHYAIEEASVRHKLRNFTRHYSEESLHGSSQKDIYSTRIHSSADEISSVNRSPSISSSDESFSRTDFSRTDAESPSPQRTPSFNDERFKYLFGDVKLEGTRCVSGLQDLSPHIYSDYLSSIKGSSDDSSQPLNCPVYGSSFQSKGAGHWRESDIARPLKEYDILRKDDLFIPKLTAEFLSDKAKRSKHNSNSSRNGEYQKRERCRNNDLSHSASPCSDKTRSGCRVSYVDEDANSLLRTSASGSSSHLRSLEKSPCESGLATPESMVSVMVLKKHSLSREENSAGHHSGNKESLKRKNGEGFKKDGGSQTEPMAIQSNGEVERQKTEKSSSLEGFVDDRPSSRGNSTGRYSNSPTSYGHESDRNISFMDTLEEYKAIQKVARMQEAALQWSKAACDRVGPDSIMLGLHFDPCLDPSVLQLTTLPSLCQGDTSVRLFRSSECPVSATDRWLIFRHPKQEEISEGSIIHQDAKAIACANKSTVEGAEEDGTEESSKTEVANEGTEDIISDEEIRDFEEAEKILTEEEDTTKKENGDHRELKSTDKTNSAMSSTLGVPCTDAETSQSEWSEDEELGASEPLLDQESTGYTTDDPALEHASMINDAGLTDAEGALSDVNSLYNDPHQYDGDMDDTSMSSRASSRIFDNDALVNFDSIHAYYEPEYDNCHQQVGRIVADSFDTEAISDVDFDGLEGINLRNIRTMSESITRNFGQPSQCETDIDSDI